MSHHDRCSRAAWLIECDFHAHFVSKAGSVISSKSPSPAFRWAAFTTQSRSSLTGNSKKTKNRQYYCAIMKLKKSFAIMTAICVASQWTTALCSKCCSIWKHVKIPHLITCFTPNSLHNVSRVFEINPSVRWCGFLHRIRQATYLIVF